MASGPGRDEADDLSEHLPAGPLHALHDVVPPLELDVRLTASNTCGEDLFAIVAAQRSFEDDERACSEARLGLVGLGADLRRHGFAVGRKLDVALLQATPNEVLPGLCLFDLLDVAR